nr:MAG TPA: hypothetical protein [Caudoviricetes sp.]DAU20579.1 MAG TPA: hypothetical protein [Caudoviricetes sp.]DAX14518.1 MAG TPA: hypothetical protein [Bacteriophage sp.]
MFENYKCWTISNQDPNRIRLIDYLCRTSVRNGEHLNRKAW